MSSEIKTERDKLCIFCLKICPLNDFQSVNNGSRNGDAKDCDFNGIICEDVAIVNSLAKFFEGFIGQNVKVPFGDITTGHQLKTKGVGCCVDCRVIINSLCSVYHQLKCLELQLEWKLETLVNIMKMANRIPSRAQQLQKVFQQENNEDDDGNDIASQLTWLSFKWFRKDVVKKCKKKLSTSKPRVFLRRLKNDNNTGIIKSAVHHNNSEVNPETTLILTSPNVSLVTSVPTNNFDATLDQGVDVMLPVIPATGKQESCLTMQTPLTRDKDQTVYKMEEEHNNLISKTATPDAIISLAVVMSLALALPPINVTKNDGGVKFPEIVVGNDQNSPIENEPDDDDNESNSDFDNEWNPEPETEELPKNEFPQLNPAVKIKADAAKLKTEVVSTVNSDQTGKCTFQCEVCSKQFKGMWLLKRHKTTQHIKKKAIRQENTSVLPLVTTSKNHDEQNQNDTTREKIGSETCYDQIICKDKNETLSEKHKPTLQRYSFRQRRKRSFPEVHEDEMGSEFEEDTPKDAYSAGSDCSSSTTSFSECESDSGAQKRRNTMNKRTPGKKRRRIQCVECEICKVKVKKYHCSIIKHFRICHNATGMDTLTNTTGGCIANFESDAQNMQFQLKNVQTSGVEHLEIKKDKNIMGTNLKCKRCNKRFRSRKRFKLHNLQYHPTCSTSTIPGTSPAAKLLNRNFCKLKCPVQNCPEKFETQLGLETHKELHGSYKCKFCEVVKDHPTTLAVHETEHAIRAKTFNAKSDKTIFHCARCPKNYLLQHKLLRHYLKQHLNLSSKLPVQTCTICSSENRGGTENYFPEHYRIHHNIVGMDPSDIQRCHQCSAYFIKSEQLTNHLIITHFKRKCPECNKSLTRCTRPSTLRKHIERKHPFSNAFPHLVVPCDMGNCKRKFVNEAELNLHKAQDRHYDERVVKCSQCDREFQGEEKLRAHMYHQHKIQPHICQECGKSFKRKQFLHIHQEYHKDPNEWRFQCVTCGKKCVDKQKLTEHQRTHTKEKPFVCQFCGERYAHRHNWRSHMKTKHEGQFSEAERVIKSRNYLSRKGSKKGDCITAGTNTIIA